MLQLDLLGGKVLIGCCQVSTAAVRPEVTRGSCLYCLCRSCHSSWAVGVVLVLLAVLVRVLVPCFAVLFFLGALKGLL
jgi:hypothetical protein